MMLLDQIRESPNYERLKKSVELRHAKSALLTYTVLTLICVLIPICLAADPENHVAGVTVIALVMLPILLFYLHRIVTVFRYIDRYVFCETLLNEPRSGLNRDTMCFRVTLTDRMGRAFQTETHGIFQTRGLWEPQFEDYINKTALIAYNEETQNVVVIGLANN